MNHLARSVHYADPVDPLEVRTWCDRWATQLPPEDRVYFEPALSDCEPCKDGRADELHRTKPQHLAKTEGTKLNAPDQPRGCNMHEDCAASEAQAARDGKPERFGTGSVRLAHCHDETCEDCFGS